MMTPKITRIMCSPESNFKPYNKGAFKIRIGFWGVLYYNYNEEPLTIVLVII